MKLHILGAGCPDPHPARYGSGFCLDLGEERILVDCGPATTWKLSMVGLHPINIDTLFLTHHHTDHNVDFPCFALTRWDIDHGDCPPLKVYGPSPTKAFCDAVLALDGPWAADIDARLKAPASHYCHAQRGGSLPRWKPQTHATDIESGFTLETDRWRVKAVQVQHVEPYLISLAYRFETDQGSIVFAGDCTDCDSLRELAKDVDTLVMCCTFLANEKTAPQIFECVAGVPEVIAVGQAANPKRIILTHANRRFTRPGLREKAVSQIARSFDGELLFPDERITIQL